jgi:hypothetical protein
MIVNGVSVRVSNANMLPLPTDGPLLLFLAFNKAVGKYEIYHQRSFAFGLEGGQIVRALVRDADVYGPEITGTNVEQLATRVDELVRQVR